MKRIKVASISLSLLLLVGCAVAVVGGAVGGIATYKYVSGRLEVIYGYPYEQVWRATQKAVKSLKFIVDSSSHDALEGVIQCRSATGKKIKIEVKNEGENVTKVYIKVGIFGDLDFSLKIKEEIDKFLKTKK